MLPKRQCFQLFSWLFLTPKIFANLCLNFIVWTFCCKNSVNSTFSLKNLNLNQFDEKNVVLQRISYFSTLDCEFGAMWKFGNFPDTQILHEIYFNESVVSKSDISSISAPLKFLILGTFCNLLELKMAKHQNSEHLQSIKRIIFETLKVAQIDFT